jgi:hypothetical protein
MLATAAACIGDLADALRVARKPVADEAWQCGLRKRSVTPPIRSRRECAMLELVNREDDSLYPPPALHPTTASLLASVMRAATVYVVPQASRELGAVRIMIDVLGFDQARAALVDALRLISASR